MRQLRMSRRLSQEKLGDACDSERTFISMLERGLVSPTLRTIVKLTSTLGLSRQKCFGERSNRTYTIASILYTSNTSPLIHHLVPIQKCAYRAFPQELDTGIVLRGELVTDAQLFGKRLRAARKMAGVKQGVLAKALDVDPKHISRLESGKVKPSFDLICQAGKVLKAPFLELDIAEENPSVLKKRIIRELDAIGIDQLQRVYRVLKALVSP